MSEYQYYEFLSIDRPLTSEEMSALRDLSTRAHITPVSFSNEYNWGNFKGDPDKLMQRFFDAHVYVANWMTAIFMVRLPIEAMAKETVKAMAVPYILDFKATKTHWVITWRLEESENYERFGMEDGRGWMARLAPVRDELLRGDIRSLYIGWLAAVAGEMMDDDEMEPLPMNGLGSLTAAQQALAEFLEVDQDLLAGAGMGSPTMPNEGIPQQDLDEWIDGLPRDEVAALLKQLLDGKGQQAERTLKNRFAAWRDGSRNDRNEAPRRRIGELRKNAEAAEKIRLEQKKSEQKKREIKRRKEREAYLKAVSTDFPKAWKAVQQVVERGSGSAYDEACRALVDLSEAYSFHANQKRFQQELNKFMAGHMRRKALIQRLVKAGIWKG
ncbi:MAG: hypothetical protein KKH68_14310 [Proteobacteria bacterium]|nr:hypothetical protein [Pseudomonadota bacterium]